MNMSMFEFMYVFVCLYVHLYMFVLMYVFVGLYMYLYIFVFGKLFVYACVYVLVFMRERELSPCFLACICVLICLFSITP